MSEENKIFTGIEEVKSPLKRLPDLKTLREQRGLTIDDIFQKTRINVTILNAIENSEFHLLPASVYAINFIRSYATTIGIDAENILAHYQRYLNETQVVPEETEVVNVQIAFDRKPFARYLLFAVPAVAIIALFVMYAIFHEKEPLGIIRHNVTVSKQKETAQTPPPVVKERASEAVVNVPQTSQPPTMAVHKETAQTPGNPLLDLHIEATEDTWLNIAEDRNPPFQITLKAGYKLNRKARESFVIDVGNAAGVNITFLGKSLGNLGRKGQVVHLRLPQQ